RNQRGESCGLGDREIGEHLAVDRDLSLAEAVDKSTIGQPVIAHRGVDALDPQGAEIALLVAPVPVGVLAGLVDGGLGGPAGILAAAVKALRLLQDLLVTGVSGDASFTACHLSSP